MGTVRLARVYDPPGDDDGFRVLVDRVWPRGMRKADAQVDLWLKEVGPSTELRRWFGHDPERFEEFARRYRAELAGKPATEELRAAVREHPRVTLLYGARDAEHNQAVVLADVLR
jgi:DNA-3-methyladenine glycosylase